METIYEDGDYKIEVNATLGTFTLATGKRNVGGNIGELKPPHPAMETTLRKMGLNPNNLLHIVGTNSLIRKDAKDAWNEKLAEREGIRKQVRDLSRKNLLLAVPGLDKLEAAYRDEERYNEEFERMMSDEGNDGVNPPSPNRYDLDSLRKEYPRAALYLRAESYSHASNYRKSGAGNEAMKHLAGGGSSDEATSMLENWLPASAMYD